MDSTTGFVNNGSLLQYGEANSSDDWDILSLPSIESSQLRILIDGDLPTDKDGVSMSVSFFNGTIPLFSAVGTWGIQGASSAGSFKKNWKLKLKNPKTSNKLKVKFGDWFQMSSIVLKAYGVDRTLIRDSISTEIWRQMARADNGFIAPLPAYSYYNNKNCGAVEAALFSTQGFPIEVYRNGSLLGLYVIRSNNDEDAYLMDVDNPKHCLLQPKLSNNFWVDGVFNPTLWEVTSPTVQDDVFKNSVTRLFKWFSDGVSGAVDIRKTYKDYINLQTFLDYVVFTELTMGCDSIQNNLMLGSWDSTTTAGIWSIYPYDMDQTFGIIGGNFNIIKTDPLTFGWVTRPNNGEYTKPFYSSNEWFVLFENTFRPELWERWAYLRKNNVISSKNINKIINNQTGLINPQTMQADLALWPISEETGIGSGNAISDNGARYSIPYVIDFVGKRIDWLDTQFKYK